MICTNVEDALRIEPLANQDFKKTLEIALFYMAGVVLPSAIGLLGPISRQLLRAIASLHLGLKLLRMFDRIAKL